MFSPPDVRGFQRKAQPDSPTLSTGTRIISDSSCKELMGDRNKENQGKRAYTCGCVLRG